MMEQNTSRGVLVQHRGRGGFVELDGCRYPIAMEANGAFTIFFPSHQQPDDHQADLDTLVRFAQSRTPAWAVENRSQLAPTD